MTQLLAANGAEYDNFGSSVSISKDASTIVVGADWVDFDSTITQSGAAYMFRTLNSTTTVQWTQMGKFVADDRDTNDHLGSSIAIENNIVVVGVSFDDSTSGSSDAGSVYILDTGFLSTPTTTTAPTAEPSTPEPTRSPTLKPTNAPTVDESSTPSPLPMTNPPTSPSTTITTIAPSPIGTDMGPTNSPPTYNTTIIKPPPTDQPTNADSETVFTPGVIVGVAAIVGLGVIVIVLGILTYRIKVQRQQQAMSTGGPPILPLPVPPPADDDDADDDDDDEPIMANVVLEPPAQPPAVLDGRTLEADAFLDAAITTPIEDAAIIANVVAGKELPRYKDQARTLEPPSGPSINVASTPKRKRQQQQDPDPPHRDPPAAMEQQR
jgi:hypothetical protein